MMFSMFAAVLYTYLIQQVTSQCPQNCQTCSNTNQCLSCKVGYWGINASCLNTCSGSCANLSCDEDGYCYACREGMYGLDCNQDCQLCENGECGLRTCTSGCKAGYYQYISGNNSYCYPCPVNCQQCHNVTYCTLCDTGYYISKYTYPTEPKRGTAVCAACENNNICDVCSTFSNCSQCSLSGSKVSCEHCVEGYTLDNSQCVRHIPCSLYCLNGCTPSGVCDGCIDGRTGSSCNYVCIERCAKCSQSNQNLCQACKNGFYNDSCDISCPQNCANRQCDFNNGSCLNGCLSGFWGEKCEHNCSDHCKQFDCHRNGTCTTGCTDDYDGMYCNITMTTMNTSSSSSAIVPSNTRSEASTTTTKTAILTSTSSSEIGTPYADSTTRELTVGNSQGGSSISASMLGGAVTGAVLITALIVGSIAFVLHRRSVSRTSNKEQRTDSVHSNTVGRLSVNEETGQNINKASEMETNQTPEISVYDKLSRTNTEHVYSCL